MEFKGTKGKWLVNPEHLFYNGNKAFEVNFGNDRECVAEIVHNKYDAILISKAPEMLDMLKAIDSVLDDLWQRDDKNILFEYLSGIDTKQLIKEATEL